MSSIRQPKQKLNEALIEAVIKDDIHTIKSLLKQGAEPNGHIDGDKLTPLFFAASNNALQSAFFLMTHGADPNYYCEGPRMTPLEAAKLYNYREMIALLQSSNENKKIIFH